MRSPFLRLLALVFAGFILGIVLQLVRPSETTVNAQECQILSESIVVTGASCTQVTALLGCGCNPGIGPCGHLYFCSATACGDGTYVSYTSFCA